MEQQKNPINESLTDNDLDVLSGMMVIFLHSAERIIKIMEFEYERRYRIGKEYKQYVKRFGKAKTDEVVKQEVQRIVRGDERSKGCPNLRSWLAGCPVEGLRDATLEWQTQREKDLQAAHQRVEEAKQALEDAIKE